VRHLHHLGFGLDVAPVTIISGAVAALVCPVARLLTTGSRPIPKPLGPQGQATHATSAGCASLAVLSLGFLIVIGGILMASQASPRASAVALTGIAIFFAGGLWRALGRR
jgi:hypothetical protein